MSRSYKKVSILKQKGPEKESYWKKIRRKTKQQVKDIDNLEEVEISLPKEIVNDYDYVDYISNCEDDNNCYCMRKYGRKKCTEK